MFTKSEKKSEKLPTARPSANQDLVISYRTLSVQISQSGKRSSNDDEEYLKNLDYQTKEPESLCKAFNIDPSIGLDATTVAARAKKYGPNTLQVKKPNYIWKLLGYLFGGFCSVLWIGVIVFFICWRPPLSNPPSATNLSLAILILIVIFLQVVFSALEDWSTGKVMGSIMDLLPTETVIIRDGDTTKTTASNLVVGDIVVLSAGNKVPADMRIIEASDDLQFDRSLLTGESESIRGSSEATEDTFLESNNIALMGTHVLNGKAKCLVLLTGQRTVIGRISVLTNDKKKELTLIQKEINRFVYIIITLTVILLSVLTLLWGVWLHKDHKNFITVVGLLDNLMGLIVAFIPEGMPIAVTLTLSLIARRMKQAQVLPKSLSTVETLGVITVICSDKTGTLTENKMFVTNTGFADAQMTVDDAIKIPLDDNKGLSLLHQAAVLCNDAEFEPETINLPVAERGMIGNATDCAILRFAESLGPSTRYSSTMENVFNIPFNSRNKWMMSLYRNIEEKYSSDELSLFCKGAPDIVLNSCTHYWDYKEQRVVKMTDAARAKFEKIQDKWSSKGQRVLALCSRSYKPSHPVGSNLFTEEVNMFGFKDLTLIGLVGIIDPPRAEIPQTVADCRRAGPRFFMVTGDFRNTAAAIARQVGIITVEREPDSFSDIQTIIAEDDATKPFTLEQFERCALVLEGQDVDAATEKHWNVICCYEEVVFSRTTPEQKLKIVEAYKARDQVVAVTGDGVNDAPALKAAHVGVAVASGSDVALEAADLILIGSFSSIVEGIRLGRLVFQNLQKVISYLLPAGSWSEIWPVLTNMLFGCPLPLSSFLMIVICVFTDLVQSLTLVMEKEEFDLLSLPPRNAKKDHLINLQIYGQSYLFIGMMEMITAHSMFFFYFWHEAKIPMKDLFFAYESYTDGFHGYSQDQLNNFTNTAQCVYFVTLVMLQWGNMLSVRTRRMSILQADPIRPKQRNIWLPLGALLGFIIAIFVTEVPGLQNLFLTASVPVMYWLIPLPLALGIIAMDEIRKLLVRAFPRGLIAKISW